MDGVDIFEQFHRKLFADDDGVVPDILALVLWAQVVIRGMHPHCGFARLRWRVRKAVAELDGIERQAIRVSRGCDVLDGEAEHFAEPKAMLEHETADEAVAERVVRLLAFGKNLFEFVKTDIGGNLDLLVRLRFEFVRLPLGEIPVLVVEAGTHQRRLLLEEHMILVTEIFNETTDDVEVAVDGLALPMRHQMRFVNQSGTRDALQKIQIADRFLLRHIF